MSSVLAHHLDATLTPLLDPKMGSDPVWVPEELEARLFPDLPEDAPTQRLFALLDAGKLPFLAERLAQSGLRHQCLYEFDDFNDEASDVAPWLVELTPESNLLRHFFAFDPEAEDPFHLLALGAGILLRTHSDITQLRAHLRHYSVLPDESGARMVLRMAEPGALDAVLSASRAEECAAFFAQVLEVTYLLASLEDNKWDAISVSYAGPVQDTRARPVLDRVRRDSLRSMHNTIRARTLARATGGDLGDRQWRTQTYHRIYMTGYDNDETLIKTHDLLTTVPEGAVAPYWDAVRSGQHSLGFLTYRLAAHYGLEGMVQ